MPMRQNLLHRGSSPHVRGALKQDVARLRTAGIIPACAGSTQIGLEVIPCGGDHPRMCGEHAKLAQALHCNVGSSPHVRGARVRMRGTAPLRGIIPACAGSPGFFRCCSPGCRDHPRMCGEHSGGSAVGNSIGGSSPHVRGALRNERENIGKNGIIPACAGSTSTGIRFRSCSGDHPRMCGEHCYS